MGGCKGAGLDGFDELPEFDEFDEPPELELDDPEVPAEVEPELFAREPLVAVPDLAVPVPERAVPVPGDVLDVLPVLAAERFVLVTAACVDPGSAAATAPAATTLATLTVTVVALRRRRPRSRSATACETLRAPRAGGDPLRESGLLMLVSLAHPVAGAVDV